MDNSVVSIEVTKACGIPTTEINISAPGVLQSITLVGEVYVHVKDVPVIREDEMETVQTVGEALLTFGGE